MSARRWYFGPFEVTRSPESAPARKVFDITYSYRSQCWAHIATDEFGDEHREGGASRAQLYAIGMVVGSKKSKGSVALSVTLPWIILRHLLTAPIAAGVDSDGYSLADPTWP